MTSPDPTTPAAPVPTGPLASAMDRLNQGWSLLVVEQLMDGPSTLPQLAQGIPSVNVDQIEAAVGDLRAFGLIEIADPADPNAPFTLTRRGRALGPVVEALVAWGRQIETAD